MCQCLGLLQSGATDTFQMLLVLLAIACLTLLFENLGQTGVLAIALLWVGLLFRLGVRQPFCEYILLELPL